MNSSSPAAPNLPRLFIGVLIGLIAIWLLTTLYFVNLEFDDGYSTISNSLYFSGYSEFYAWPRGPLLGLMLAPAAMAAAFLETHPLDVRPYHAIMVVLHLLYLAGVWKLISDNHGRTWSVALAYVAAIPTVVFFSYAPFISHDILPGLLALAMIRLADDFMDAPKWRYWLGLVVLGAVAASIKQTYALIWIAILIAVAVLVVQRSIEVRWRLAGLALAALTSGLLTWCAYAQVMAPAFPEIAFWERPALQIKLISEFNQPDSFYQWVYLRNLSAYGILAMCLLVPGVLLSLHRGSRQQKIIALAWIALVTALAIIDTKEVRYLAFLAPLNACLIIPVILRLARQRKPYTAVLWAIAGVGLVTSTMEAARVFAPYYRTQVAQFFQPMPLAYSPGVKVVMVGILNFIAEQPAFFGDRYHRITHLMSFQLRSMFGIPPDAMPLTVDPAHLTNDDFKTGDILIYSSGAVARQPPISRDNRPAIPPGFAQVLAVAETITLELADDRYFPRTTADRGTQPILLLRSARGSGEPIFSNSGFAIPEIQQLTGVSGTPNQIEILGFAIKSLCDPQNCQIVGP